jgi:hypothetical protein
LVCSLRAYIALCCFIVAIWGLDEHGYFCSGDEASATGVVDQLKQMVTGAAVEGGSAGNVAERVLTDLKGVHARLLAEAQFESEQPRSNKEKGKHLLFLFQRDLLPGVSGKILESKGQRDNIAVKHMPWEAKAACWAFIGLLNVGMLFYILLFAVSQTEHQQGAWALSFAMWLVVEILFVSSATVLVTHVFVPSLIMRDVNKIKQKLAESIRSFNTSVQRQRRGKLQEGPEHFNAASYLFVSTRLAQQWSELREAQIIAQFRTPWPKQSYQRETDVSQSYSKKYTALYRSASIIAIFFLTNLLQIPPALQDMVVQMCSTAVIGYTTLVHIDLYKVYPVLVVVPTLVVCAATHFIVQSNKANAALRLRQMFPARKGEGILTGAEVHAADEQDAAAAKASTPDAQYIDGKEDEDISEGNYGALDQPPTDLRQPAPTGHTTRKQSVRYGLQVLHTLQHQTAQPGVPFTETDPVAAMRKQPNGLCSAESKAAEREELTDDSFSVSSESVDGDKAGYMSGTAHPDVAVADTEDPSTIAGLSSVVRSLLSHSSDGSVSSSSSDSDFDGDDHDVDDGVSIAMPGLTPTAAATLTTLVRGSFQHSSDSSDADDSNSGSGSGDDDDGSSSDSEEHSGASRNSGDSSDALSEET